MRVLGIDTSSKVLSLAISEDSQIISEKSHLLERRHSDLLVPKIKEMLKKIELSISDIDAFVVGLGPGSFTGLRIGVSGVKGFGIATGKPCIGVPSIDAIAMNVDRDYEAIIPVIDAKRQNVYSAVYRKKGEQVIRLSGYLLVNIDELMRKVKPAAIFLGDGIGIYRERIELLNKKAVFLEEQYWYPKAGNLIRLALGKIKRKTDLNKLKPIYLYAKDCQVKERVKFV